MHKITMKNMPVQLGSHFNPYIVLGLSVIGISFGSLFTKLAQAPPMAIAFYRILFSTLLLAPFVSFSKASELRKLTKKDLLTALASGAFLALHFAAWIISLNYTSVASSTVLVTTHPVFVAAGAAIFLDEKISLKTVPAGLLALSGSFLVGFGDFRLGGTALWGDFLAISGAVFVAGYMLIGRSLRQHLSNLSYTFLVYGSCSLLLLSVSLPANIQLHDFSPSTWTYLLALAVVPTIFGHSLFNWCLAYLRAAVVSMGILAEPLGATILALLILGEVPTVYQIAGGLLLLAGIYFFLALQQKRETD